MVLTAAARRAGRNSSARIVPQSPAPTQTHPRQILSPDRPQHARCRESTDLGDQKIGLRQDLFRRHLPKPGDVGPQCPTCMLRLGEARKRTEGPWAFANGPLKEPAAESGAVSSIAIEAEPAETPTAVTRGGPPRRLSDSRNFIPKAILSSLAQHDASWPAPVRL